MSTSRAMDDGKAAAYAALLDSEDFVGNSNRALIAASTGANRGELGNRRSYASASDAARAQQDFYTGFTQSGYSKIGGKYTPGRYPSRSLDSMSQAELKAYYNNEEGTHWGEGRTVWDVGDQGSDPFNEYSENNGTRSNNEEEESGIEPVVLSAGTSFDPSGWQLTPAPYVPYTPPAAQDWSAWMFGSPFGGQGGLAYQPGSQEYLEQYIPQNVWGSAPGLSEGVMAELAPSTGGLLEV